MFGSGPVRDYLTLYFGSLYCRGRGGVKTRGCFLVWTCQQAKQLQNVTENKVDGLFKTEKNHKKNDKLEVDGAVFCSCFFFCVLWNMCVS